MAITWNWALNIVVLMLRPIFNAITPILRKELEDFLKEYYAKAQESENPWDDYFAEFLCHLLGIEVEEAEE